MEDLKTSNPLAHSQNIRGTLQEVSDHLRKDIDKVEDVRAQVLFEASAEVIDGLIKSFSRYEKVSEEAWR